MNKSLIPLERPNGNFYAIELNQTNYKKTADLGTTSEIIFNWESLVYNIYQTKNDLSIQIAQTNPDSRLYEIKNLAKAIKQTSEILPMDRIFGLVNQRINKIGYVTTKEVVEQTTVKLSVFWIAEDALQDNKFPIFHDHKEIQTLGLRDLNIIEKKFGAELQSIYDKMPEVNNEKIKYHYLNESIAIKGISPKKDEGGKITLFYGTNRNPLNIEDNKQKYGFESIGLQYGFCEVSIPRGHIQGELERPMRIIWELPENENRHIVVKEIKPMDKLSFITAFDSYIGKTPEKNALLFIHGYNNTFEDAARRTAQLAWDLPFTGLTGFFSWPSGGRTADYLSDEAKARSSFPALQQFLKELMLETNLEHIHIIAHSMGTLVTTLSLNSLRRDGLMSPHLSKIHQLILGASDIDQEEFRNTILPEFKNIGLRRTLYASDHDFALGVSSFGRRGRQRLGQIGEGIFLDKDIDTIEASNIDSQSSHGYIFESKLLLTDLFFLLTQNLNPAQRRLREIKKNLLQYWLFLE